MAAFQTILLKSGVSSHYSSVPGSLLQHGGAATGMIIPTAAVRYLQSPGASPAAVSSSLLLPFPTTIIARQFLPMVEPTTTRISSTALNVNTRVETEALGFFSGIRIPAALIAGSSLSAFFSLVTETKKVEEEEENNQLSSPTSAIERKLLVLYHVLSLLSLLLSLNVVITATAAGTTLLLNEYDGKISSTFVFLKTHMYYEFLTTRWSFFTSLLTFIASVTTRALIVFDLIIQRKRHKLATIFLLCVGSLTTHLISFINGSLYSSPNLYVMTVEVIKVFFVRAIRNKHPLDFVSAALLVGALVVVGTSWIQERRQQQQSHGEGDEN